MRIEIKGLRELSEPKQQEVGQTILVSLWKAGVLVDGVEIRWFTEGRKK